MIIDLKPPAWATHAISDLTAWKKWPKPVAELEPVELPDDVYFEYAWMDGERDFRPDPASANVSENPWYPYSRFLKGPAYVQSAYARPLLQAPTLTATRQVIESRHLDGTRRVRLFSPAGFERERLPLLLVQDGEAYFRWPKLHEVLTDLLREDRVRPVHIAFVAPIKRTIEYTFNPRYAAYVHDEVLPVCRRELPLTDETIIWGASLSGLCAAWLAWERPDVFQTVVTQSGCFVIGPDDELIDPHTGTEWVTQQLRDSERRPLRYVLQSGSIEWLHAAHTRLLPVLEQRGYVHSYVEVNAGHNWATWRDTLADVLVAALGTDRA